MRRSERTPRRTSQASSPLLLADNKKPRKVGLFFSTEDPGLPVAPPHFVMTGSVQGGLRILTKKQEPKAPPKTDPKSAGPAGPPSQPAGRPTDQLVHPSRCDSPVAFGSGSSRFGSVRFVGRSVLVPLVWFRTSNFANPGSPLGFLQLGRESCCVGQVRRFPAHRAWFTRQSEHCPHTLKCNAKVISK